MPLVRQLKLIPVSFPWQASLGEYTAVHWGAIETYIYGLPTANLTVNVKLSLAMETKHTGQTVKCPILAQCAMQWKLN